MSEYTVVSLFSGAMGLDLGLEATGKFEVLACVENDEACCETIRKNSEAGWIRPDLKLFENDIRNVDPHDVLDSIGLEPGEVDVVVGGPPCQAFSTAGRRKATQDPRGTLLWHFLRFVKEMQPKFFLMENVRGLVSAALKHRPIAERPKNGGSPLDPEEEPGSVIELFSNDLQDLDGCSYHMDCFEVNSVNYGAPQARERALFIGNRYGITVDFPDPTHASPEEVKEERKQHDLFEDGEQALKPWATLRDAIGDLEEEDPEVMDFSERKKHYLDMVPEGSNWRSLPEDIQKESMGGAYDSKGGRSGWWRRLTYDLPAPTLLTQPNHSSTSLCHPKETRALSVREYARIQEFPDGWEFAGSTRDKYNQIGNAVPVRLGEVAGNVIAEALDSLKEEDHASQDAPENYRKVYIQAHVRRRKWYKSGKTYVWGEDEASYSPPSTERKVQNL